MRSHISKPRCQNVPDFGVKLLRLNMLLHVWRRGAAVVFQGSTEAKLAKQIGNAVPYPMAWAIMGSVFEAAYDCAAPIPPYVTAERAGRSSHMPCVFNTP